MKYKPLIPSMVDKISIAVIGLFRWFIFWAIAIAAVLTTNWIVSLPSDKRLLKAAEDFCIKRKILDRDISDGPVLNWRIIQFQSDCSAEEELKKQKILINNLSGVKTD